MGGTHSLRTVQFVRDCQYSTNKWNAYKLHVCQNSLQYNQFNVYFENNPAYADSDILDEDMVNANYVGTIQLHG